MTILNDREAVAVLVIDVQIRVVADAHDRDAVIDSIDRLVKKARQESVPIIWVQHFDAQLDKGSEDWQIVPELVPEEGEPRIDKQYGDAFEDTSLESVLTDLRVGHLVVVGAQTDACIRSTLHGAFVRGYDVTLVADGHTTEDTSKWGSPPPGQVIAHTNFYWKYHSAPGRTAATVATEDLHFRRT